MAGEDEQAERQERAAWKRFKTGPRLDYDSIQRDARGYPRFVPASQLSKDWQLFQDDAASGQREALPDAGSRVERQDVIFTGPAPQIRCPASETSTLSPAILDAPERGKSVASFYSQLPREAINDLERSQTSHSAAAQIQSIPHRMRAVQKNTSDWFIRRASSQLQDLEMKRSKARKEVIMLQSQGSCPVCCASLPVPLSTIQWDAHRSSIAHQVALDGSAASGASLAVAKRKAKHVDEKEGKVLLKSSNLGYTALERMGWTKGMGIGRAEWEHNMRLKEKARAERRRGVGEVVVISDSEDDDDAHLEIGSNEWLARVQEEQARLAASRPEGSVPEGIEDAETDQDEDKVLHSRPLLEPIAVQIRPDRRGIGQALPIASRLIDGKVQKLAKIGADAEPGKHRLTKSQKKQLERQKQEEWKELRNSLY